jgi:hypothetical protein
VVAALAGGVLEVAGGGQAVAGFVEHGGQYVAGAAAQALAADQQLVAVVVADLPAVRGEVAKHQAAGDAAGAGASDDDHVGQVGVVVLDSCPGALEGGNQPAGGVAVGGVLASCASHILLSCDKMMVSPPLAMSQ